METGLQSALQCHRKVLVFYMSMYFLVNCTYSKIMFSLGNVRHPLFLRIHRKMWQFLDVVVECTHLSPWNRLGSLLTLNGISCLQSGDNRGMEAMDMMEWGNRAPVAELIQSQHSVLNVQWE